MATLLKIYIDEGMKWQGKALYRAVVHKLKELGVAGATVTRSVEGYGGDKVYHSAKILELSLDLPMVIEVVDSKEKIAEVLPEIEKMMPPGKGLMFTVDINAVWPRADRVDEK